MKWIGGETGNELYELPKDPDETEDISKLRPRTVDELRQSFEEFEAGIPETPPQPGDVLPVTVDDFRALGYFQ